MNRVLVVILILLIPLMGLLAFNLWPDFELAETTSPPATIDDPIVGGTIGTIKPCSNDHPAWRTAQDIDTVSIEASPACEPDNPYAVAAAVKGTNNIGMRTLMQTHLAEDALIKSEDLDHDGDPDIIRIKMEVVELNGSTPDGEYFINTFDIAPGIQPGLWVFAPKSRGMALKNFNSRQANPLLRAPSPVIRVEQGDKVFITLENTHYLPHTIHLHGVDHPWKNASGKDNDGTEAHAVFPGKTHTYEMQPRHAGTMFYHCHVQTSQHLMMGLNGMFIVEENRPDNWLQTFNIGAGRVRHPAIGVKEDYQQEYDLFYQSVDKRLSSIIQDAIDPRLIAKRMSREYNSTESFENLFLLNGHSFPFTIRDSLIIAGANENIKLHIGNAQRSSVAIHIHGHKATITAYDGVEAPKGLQLTRDVYDVAPAQRIDLNLQTINDGLHSYGPGVWMMHDHVEIGATTDGMEPGGNMALMAYKEFLDDQGMPKMHDKLFDMVFDKYYYAKQRSVWAEGDSAHYFGQANSVTPNYLTVIGFGLAIGLSLGLSIALIILFKRNST